MRDGMSDFFNDEEVEVQMVDGTIRKFTKEQLIMNEEENLKGQHLCEFVQWSLTSFLINLMIM